MRTITALLPFCALGLVAQPYFIGTRDITWTDPGRGRDIPCAVSYPALTAGASAPVADGAFPVLVVGHGFVMTVDAYTYLAEHYAEAGYIVVRPTTEGSLGPDHSAFGADLAYLAGALIAANEDALSPFFGHVAPSAALIGHSMGGGAAFLGAAGNTGIRTLIGLAPAETDPSAVAAAASVTVPTLVFAGSEDCVTPIPQHQGPMYDALNAPCKAFVNITGGGHCYFGDASFTCTFGELTCGPDLTVSRGEQQDVVTDVMDLWLQLHLRDDPAALGPLLDSLAGSTRYTAETTCLATSSMADAGTSTLQVRWDGRAVVVSGVRSGTELSLWDPLGRSIQRVRATATVHVFPPLPGAPGVYLLQEINASGRSVVRMALP